MTSVILQPVGDSKSHQHYLNTIKSPVPLGDIAKYISPSDEKALRELYPQGRVPTWGVTPGKNGQNESKWKRLQPGDVTLFVRQGRVFASGVMTHKLHSQSLALDLWQKKPDGSTWEFVYFLDEVVSHSFPVTELNRVVGYKENYVVQGFNVLNEEKSSAATEHFQLESSVHYPPVTESQYIQSITPNSKLDKTVKTSRRVEQGFLRNYLFGRKQAGTCCICGKCFPIAFLVAAHLKKRAECTREERLDYRNVVAPMCKFGCDDIYEKGWIYIKDGIVRINSVKGATADLEPILNNLEGRICSEYKPESQKYFDWHMAMHFKRH